MKDHNAIVSDDVQGGGDFLKALIKRHRRVRQDDLGKLLCVKYFLEGYEKQAREELKETEDAISNRD